MISSSRAPQRGYYRVARDARDALSLSKGAGGPASRFDRATVAASVFVLAALAAWGAASSVLRAQNTPPDGFVSLFNGKDLTGWKVPEGDNGHWRVVDGVIDYDGRSEAAGNKSLWTEQEYGDVVARIDWRIKSTPYINRNVRIVKPDGSYKRNEEGEEIRIAVPDSDSGFIIRGTTKAQVNIWCWPIGSGEMYGYRTDEDVPADIRAAVTPSLNADSDIGEWNTFEVTVQGSTVTVQLNGHTIIDKVTLPGLPERGPLGLQHHGAFKDGQWVSSPALLQFRNVFVKEL